MNPQYPPAIAFVQAAGFREGGSDRKVDKLVLHVTDGGPDAMKTARYFAGGAEGKHASAHFVVGNNNGDVIQCVKLEDVAYHAHFANLDSIGIEHCARTPGELGQADAGLPMTDAQYAASARLVSWLCQRYGLPRDRSVILGHAEADPATTHTDCPTGALSWERYMAALAAVP